MEVSQELLSSLRARENLTTLYSEWSDDNYSKLESRVKYSITFSRNCPHYPNCGWRRRERPSRDALPHADERRCGRLTAAATAATTAAPPKGLHHRDALGLGFHVVGVAAFGTAENAAGAAISLHLSRAPQYLLLFVVVSDRRRGSTAAAVLVVLLSTDRESAAVVEGGSADAQLHSAPFVSGQGFLERGVEQGAKRGVQHEGHRLRRRR